MSIFDDAEPELVEGFRYYEAKEPASYSGRRTWLVMCEGCGFFLSPHPTTNPASSARDHLPGAAHAFGVGWREREHWNRVSAAARLNIKDPFYKGG